MTDYPLRLLRKNHHSTMPSRIVFLDTETEQDQIGDEERHRMDMAWTCSYEKPHKGRAATEVWEFWTKQYPMWKYIEGLARKKTQLYIMAHNIFFDLQVSGFFRYFTRQGWVLEFIFDKGLTYILTIRKDKKTIKLVSTTNYFDTSLKKLGEMIGLPKLDIDFGQATDAERKIYCRRDVEILKVAMLQYIAFLEEHDLGRFSPTRAAQAFAAYRHRFMDAKINIHSDPEIIALEQKAYIGGRCECFSLGIQKGGPFISLDINSMYPYVMKQ